MDLIESITGQVFAELFELPALADLAQIVLSLRAQTDPGERVRITQIRIHAHFAMHRKLPPRQPQAESRSAFYIHSVKRETAAATWRKCPLQSRPTTRRGLNQPIFIFSRERLWKWNRRAHCHRRRQAIVDAQLECRLAVTIGPHQRGQFQIHVFDSRRELRVEHHQRQ